MPIQKDVFIKNYLKALNNGDAAVFAGAGLSASSGCVNWKQLLKEIAEELELDIEKESDLVAVAQYYYKVGSINSIFYFLHKAAEPFNCLEQDNLA